MTIKTKADLAGLDLAYLGQPFCDVAAKSGLATAGLDVAYLGQPFLAAPDASTFFSVTLAAAGAGTSTIAKRTVLGRLLSAAASAATTFNKRGIFYRVLSSVCSAAASFNKRPVFTRLLAATESVLPFSLRRVKRNASSSGVATASIKRKGYLLIASVTALSAALLPLQVARKTLASVSLTVASRSSNLRRKVAAGSFVAAGVIRKMRRSMDALIVDVPLLVKRIRLSRIAASVGAVGLQWRVPLRLRQLTANSTVQAIRSRAIHLRRSVTRLATGVIALRRPKLIAASLGTVPSLLRSKTGRILVAGVTALAFRYRVIRLRRTIGVSGLVQYIARRRLKMAILASSVAIGSLRRNVRHGLRVTLVVAASQSRKLGRMVRVAVVSAAAFRRWMQQSFGVVATGAVTMGRRRFRQIMAGAMAIGLVAWQKAVMGWIEASIAIREAVHGLASFTEAVESGRKVIRLVLRGRTDQ